MIERWLRKYVSWSITGLSTVIFVLFTLLVLPRVSAYTAITLGGAGYPDTTLLYTGKELYNIAERYGPEGRRLYVQIRWTFDLVWPLVYSVFFTTLVISLTNDITHNIVRKLYIIPLLALVFDFTENSFATLVMLTYPKELIFLGTLTSYVSLIKWLLIGVIIIGAVMVLIYVLVQRIRLFKRS